MRRESGFPDQSIRELSRFNLGRTGVRQRTETKLLGDKGFSFKGERGQWERFDREWPGDNYQDAKAFVATLVKERSSDLRR